MEVSFVLNDTTTNDMVVQWLLGYRLPTYHINEPIILVSHEWILFCAVIRLQGLQQMDLQVIYNEVHLLVNTLWNYILSEVKN